MILKRAFLERESDKAYLISVGHQVDGKDGGLYPVWFPKSKVKFDGKQFDVPQWLVEAKEKQIAEELCCNCVEIEVAE